MATNENAANTPQAANAAPQTAVATAPKQASPVAQFKNALQHPEIQNRLGQLFDEKQKSVFVASALEVFSADSNLQKCNPYGCYAGGYESRFGKPAY